MSMKSKQCKCASCAGAACKCGCQNAKNTQLAGTEPEAKAPDEMSPLSVLLRRLSFQVESRVPRYGPAASGKDQPDDDAGVEKRLRR